MKSTTILKSILLAMICVVLFNSVSFAENIKFAIIGDRTGEAVPGIYESIIEEINKFQLDFVITVGDMIEGYALEDSVINWRWDEYDVIASKLNAPLYLTPGNNDIWSDASAEIYQKRKGNPYYSFDIKNMHIIVLNNSRGVSPADMPDEQFHWLNDDLMKNANAKYKLVFMHKPFWYQNRAKNKSDRLHDLLREYNVDAVFTGHYHEYFSGQYDGIKYIGVGSSGADAGNAASAMLYHFMIVNIDQNGISINPIWEGQTMPWDETTVADKVNFDKIKNMGLDFISPAIVNDNLRKLGSKTSIRINNDLSSMEITNDIIWDVPENWQITPETLAVNIEPGIAMSFNFVASCRGDFYPLPKVKVKFQFAENRSMTVEKELWVAREVTSYPVSDAIIIDGKLDEPAWKSDSILFFNSESKIANNNRTSFYFLHDDQYLYIAAKCRNDVPGTVVATATDHDGPVYAEDCIGFFIEPVIGSDTIYQIYVNPLGTIYDQCYAVDSEGWEARLDNWNGIYESKGQIKPEYWTVELKIPVDQFGASLESGTQWRLNFRRKIKHDGTVLNWQVPIDTDPQTMGILNIK